jgi:Flp pilus assembly protein TadD
MKLFAALFALCALTACQQMMPMHPTDGASVPVAENAAAVSPAVRLLIRTDPAEAVRQLSRIPSPSPAVLNNLGVALDLTGQHRQAQAAYREALAAQPGLQEPMNNLALSLALQRAP